LSFTLALHEVSGFDSPILIDTPVARISEKHRESFGRIFEEVSREKQTILLFTGPEYSEEIRRLLDTKASGRYVMETSSDEMVTRLEVL
jgi:DNA sulfur modification protein DndD